MHKKMRKVILNLTVSLDGFIEDANGAYDWCFTDQDYGMSDFLQRTDTILFGRKSYDLVVQQDEDYFPAHQKIVFSRQSINLKDGYQLMIAPRREQVHEILASPGKDIWLFGGSSIVKSMMEWGYINQLMLAVHPILLGSGKRLFEELPGRIPLKLIDTITYDTGLVQLIYEMEDQQGEMSSPR
jgi:dihydrofolate reductase